jgi:exodeoxyribonuclease VII large subunit
MNEEEKRIFTVSQYLELLNIYLRREVVHVSGEIVELKEGAKWISFTLKDKEDGSIMKCVLGAWDYRRIGTLIEVGMEVCATGTPSVSKKFGSFGFWVKHIEPLGEGALQKAYELLVKKLQAEGLFARKREIPENIQNIGVISSREGVVIHDFMNNLKKRGYKITFVDSRVEGDSAPEQLIQSMRTLLKKDIDVLVVIRGGGSLESMQAFNNELVCRELFASPVPTIVGIGHDVNVPIACMVADASASTPTGVTHIVNESWDDFVKTIDYHERAIFDSYREIISSVRDRILLFDRIAMWAFRLLFDSLHKYEAQLRKCVFDIERNIEKVSFSVVNTRKQYLDFIQNFLRTCAEKIHSAEQVIEFASPLRNLARGYSITTDGSGRVIRSLSKYKKGDQITTRLEGGTIESQITNTKKHG